MLKRFLAAMFAVGFALTGDLLGSAIGGVAGAWMGAGMLSTYRPFFRFPETPFLMPAWALSLGVAASLGRGALGRAWRGATNPQPLRRGGHAPCLRPLARRRLAG
jgi:hypothetical protein